MMMDEEMMEPLKGDLLCFEIDLDYEFDAPRFFDLSREELFAEACEAQIWFERAPSYPPSPFIARLNIGEDILMGNVETLLNFKEAENCNYVNVQSDIDNGPPFSALDETSEVYRARNKDAHIESKKFIKGVFSSGSTLMKPTASQLAKQNRLHEVKRSQLVHRALKPYQCKEIIENMSETGGRASKRQKLEGGHLQKVVCMKEPTNLLHKAPQKKSIPVDINSHNPRLRITIPREPELETAQRAQRRRFQTFRSADATESQEGKVPAAPVFRAHPLNRKILEGPLLPLPQRSTPRLPQFQPFHLKTEDRALQHTVTSSSSLVAKDPLSVSAIQAGALGLKKLQGQPSGPSLSRNVEQKHEGCDSVQVKFKAQPLDKKILSSKGDVGVFRSTKRETTKPMEFNFSTSKRCWQDPPTELLDKLSLNTDMHPSHPSSVPQTMLLFPSHGMHKDSKENMNCSIQQEPKDIHVKEDLKSRGKKHMQSEGSSHPGYRSKTAIWRNRSQRMGIR